MMTTKSGAINRAMITRDGLTAAYRSSLSMRFCLSVCLSTGEVLVNCCKVGNMFTLGFVPVYPWILGRLDSAPLITLPLGMPRLDALNKTLLTWDDG